MSGNPNTNSEDLGNEFQVTATGQLIAFGVYKSGASQFAQVRLSYIRKEKIRAVVIALGVLIAACLMAFMWYMVQLKFGNGAFDFVEGVGAVDALLLALSLLMVAMIVLMPYVLWHVLLPQVFLFDIDLCECQVSREPSMRVYSLSQCRAVEIQTTKRFSWRTSALQLVDQQGNRVLRIARLSYLVADLEDHESINRLADWLATTLGVELRDQKAD